MIETLIQTAEGECRHCGGRILRFRGSAADYGWTHVLGERYQHECPDAPVAQPKITGRCPEHALTYCEPCGWSS